ncbi:type I 3-dehydroquinate dehydratase, partial [Bacillus sp. JCM 19041]|uniref:type I 3-dehydroquinate dehydratase n=1 Tax=Bacillus sp. JCM 19041 TaxID=1460637 RepID=UPI0006D117DB
MKVNQSRKVLEARGVKLGCGKPKICIPIVGENLKELLSEIDQLPTEAFDIVEWRVDFLKECEQVDQVLDTLSQVRKAIKDKPLIFTFRSEEEGGQKQLTDELYVSLLRAVVQSRLVEYIDIELTKAEADVRELIATAHMCGCYVIVSNHEFAETPTKEVMTARLLRAIDLGADVPKLAVMPQNSADVLALLEVTLFISEKSPVPI